MPLVFRRDSSDWSRGDLFGVKGDSSEEIVVRRFLSGKVSLSRCKDGPFCVIGPQYYGELGMIDPSPLPIYLWLRSGEPRISQDCLLFSEFCEVELEVGMVVPCLDL